VLLAGPTSSGKSTTLATLIDRINSTRQCHLITIEDPVEYIHKSRLSLVSQRQIGIDAPSFYDALVSALRQDPDVILVGEIRDLPTMRTAITAAETGHLVFATVHAGDTTGAIERVIAVFPGEEQDGIRRQLSFVLRAAITQHLLPADGLEEVRTGSGKRVIASEVMRITGAISNLIATGRTGQIYSAIETGMEKGMQTLEQDLARLWTNGVISEAAALALTRSPDILRNRAALLRRSRESA
jgi:twitching motility protein PilT